MKMPHNYIKPLPPQEEQKLYQWYTYSVYAFIMCVILFLSINFYQYFQFYTVNNTRSAMQTTLYELQKSLEKNEPLKQQHAQLTEQITTLENLKKQQHDPLEILSIIEKTIPADACLTEFSYHDHGELSLHGYAQTAETALLFLTAMQETPALKNIELSSLAPVTFQEQRKTWYQFHMKLKKAQKNAPQQT